MDKIKNTPIGKFADYKLLSMALDIPEIRNIFDLMENFNQDLYLSDDASLYFHDVIEQFSIPSGKRINNHPRKNNMGVFSVLVVLKMLEVFILLIPITKLVPSPV